MFDQTLLKCHLSLCVPLEIDHLKRHGGVTEWHIEQAQSAMSQTREDNISESVLFRMDGTGRAVARLSECLAILSFQPGGVEFAGLHFDACRHGWMKEASA